MTGLVCDINPEHGPMQAEPIYHLDGTVYTERGLYWFCQVPECDGYGGPVKKAEGRKARADTATNEQLVLFE